MNAEKFEHIPFLSVADINKFTVLNGNRDIYAMPFDMASRYETPARNTEYRRMKCPDGSIRIGWIADNATYLHNVPYTMVGDYYVTVDKAVSLGAVILK